MASQFGRLIGRRIVAIEPLTREQATQIGFDPSTVGGNPVLVISLDGGDMVVLTADPECNGPGWMEILEPRTD